MLEKVDFFFLGDEIRIVRKMMGLDDNGRVSQVSGVEFEE